jgi:methionyl aminopeptidase
MPVKIKSKDEWDLMRAAGKLAATVLNELSLLAKPGVTTDELNTFAHKFTLANGAESAPLGYKMVSTDPPFPKSICTSVNNVVCHGIPDDTILKDGDVVNCDITVKLNGYHGDTSRTFLVGNVDSKSKKLVKITERAMHKGIQAIKPGGCISDIGLAIQNYISPYNYGIVRELSGHGIGKGFHEEPSIYHYHNKEHKYELIPGMCITVEPMINQGSPTIALMEDKWTIVTVDGLRSAQFEHTILVTDTGYEILTQL